METPTSGFMTSLLVTLTNFIPLRFEKVRENDTRKTSNVEFQTLRFEKVRENDTRKT
jgi:hypothetical protein